MTDSPIQPWLLTSTNLARVRETHYEVAVLPVGAVEPHNLHLPFGQDTLHGTHVAERCCAEAWAAGARVACLPTIPYGVDCNLLDFPMTMHVSQSSLEAMVNDLIDSAARHGLRKFVILNAHGGNDFLPLVRQVQCETDVHVFLCNWWTVAADRYGEIFEKPDDHAGEMETSVALALWPQLVELDRAGDGATRRFRIEALEKGYVRTSRNFARLNDHCAAGDPRAATAEKGRTWLDAACARITGFLVDLSAAAIDETFPHAP